MIDHSLIRDDSEEKKKQCMLALTDGSSQALDSWPRNCPLENLGQVVPA